jgi:DNA-binding LytR/AlgR family response regulator
VKSQKIKISITEDEALIADHLAACLEDLGYEISSVCDNAKDTLVELAINRPDILIVDINIHGDMDGVDLVNTINKSFRLPVIYLTSNSDKQTIERVKHTRPAGFILKPYTVHDLETNIEIALFKYAAQEDSTNSQPTTSETLPVLNDAFFIKDKHALIKVSFDEILYAEAMDNYCVIYTSHKKYILSQTLKLVELKLNPHGFIRVHRSHLLNLKHVTQIQPKSVFIDNHEIPLSDSYKKELMERINLF